MLSNNNVIQVTYEKQKTKFLFEMSILSFSVLSSAIIVFYNFHKMVFTLDNSPITGNRVFFS